MSGRLFIGVDPGHNATGIAAVDEHRNLTHWHLIERPDNCPLSEWAAMCADNVELFHLEAQARRSDRVLLAVEGFNPPTPEMGMTSVPPLLSTAAVLGGICARMPWAQVIPPQGFSNLATQPKRVLAELFPAELIGRPVKALKDVRSAYLVACEFAQRALRESLPR